MNSRTPASPTTLAPAFLRAALHVPTGDIHLECLSGDLQWLCGMSTDALNLTAGIWGKLIDDYDAFCLTLVKLTKDQPLTQTLYWNHTDGHKVEACHTFVYAPMQGSDAFKYIDIFVRFVGLELLDYIKALESSYETRSKDCGALSFPKVWEEPGFYERVVGSVNDGILVNDPNGQILYMNENLAKLLGYSPGELLGKHLFDVMDEEGIQLTKKRLSERISGTEEVFDFRFVHRNGAHVWTRVSAKPLVDDDERHMGSLVSISDISARKKAEQDLQVLLNELEQRVQERTKLLTRANSELKKEVEERKSAEKRAILASRAKSQFLANMSHELRTPLNAIIGYSEILEEEMQSAGVDDFQQDIECIHSSAQHLLQLISSILDLSNIEAGRMELQSEEIYLDEFLSELRMMMEDMLQQSELLFIVEQQLDTMSFIADRGKLRQIIFNFLSNAVKFTLTGSICLRVRHDVDQAHIIFDVEDTGIGIHEDDIDALFSAFWQADGSATRRFEGAGLGLAIAQEYTRLMGGRISVKSKYGEGSTFSVAIPTWHTLDTT